MLEWLESAKGLRDISILVKLYLFKSSSDLENDRKLVEAPK